MKFLPVKGANLIAFVLTNHANGDSWNNILIVFNSRKKSARLFVPKGRYTIVCKSGKINPNGIGNFSGTELLVPAQSALIMHQ